MTARRPGQTARGEQAMRGGALFVLDFGSFHQWKGTKGFLS